MFVEVTLSLPVGVIERAKLFGRATRRDVETVLKDALEMMWPPSDDSPADRIGSPVSELSDKEVLTLADSKMDVVQNRRLGELQARGKTEGLSEAERYELNTLMQIYKLGQIRKSEGLAEAVSRGLRKPLSP